MLRTSCGFFVLVGWLVFWGLFSLRGVGAFGFFLWGLAIRTSSFKKALFNSFAHFFSGSLIFWEFNIFSSLYILVILSLVRCIAGKDFPHYLCCLFNLVSPICQFFLLVAEPMVSYLRKLYMLLYAPVYSLIFSALVPMFQTLYLGL
jgi:hypothetical protein